MCVCVCVCSARFCFAGSTMGTSARRGVCLCKQNGRWKAQIKTESDGMVYIGVHHHEDAAARAYDRLAIRTRGFSNAVLNFPRVDYAEEVEAIQEMSIQDLAMVRESTEEGRREGGVTGM